MLLGKWQKGRGVLFAVVAAMLFASAAKAQVRGHLVTTFSDQKSGEKEWRYQANQIKPVRPKFDYTDDGRAIMIKRYPFFPTQNACQFIKYRYVDNKDGVEHFQKCCKLKREPGDILTSDQKAILKEWGQPDYLRGPYKSTRGESNVTEWVYHPLNHLFQFIDGEMVYEGPLTDQERTALVHGAPGEVIVSQVEPNIRRETWIYRPVFLSGREKLYSFTNGRLTYSQETP
jgi:hypothetical protein